jgi:hypothetical protein
MNFAKKDTPWHAAGRLVLYFRLRPPNQLLDFC